MLCKLYINCKICEVRFTQSGSLNGHISAVHEVNMVVDMGTVGICAKAVIARKNQTYFQFSLITEGFQSHYSFGKTFSFSSKTEGNTNFSVRLKQKVFQ